MVVKLLEKLLANSTAGGAGGVDGVDLSALATIHDLQATHCGEDFVLHFLTIC